MDDISKDDVEVISNFIATQKLPNLTDEHIARFLRICQNDLQATKDKIVAHFLMKKENPEIFQDWNLQREDLKFQLKTIKLCVCPKKTDDGSIIVHIGLNDFSYRNYVHASALKLFIMTMEATIVNHNPESFIILYDMEGVGLMHLTRVKLNLIKLFFNYLQDKSSIKVKFVHFLNCVYFMDKCMSIIKPFVSRELFDTFRFYPSNTNMDDFYANCIPKKCLPKDFGGYLPSIADLQADNINKLNDMKDYFLTKEDQLQAWNHKQ